MKTGKAFWRTLDELADDPSFVERLHNEFPSQVEAITDPTTRRTFMKLMGASLALAGVTACTTQPDEAIVPYVRQPEELVPGKPMYYATAMALGGVATGLLVESHEGRPTKIEGNPLHPSSLGAADVFAQASILNIYDPDRVQTLTNAGDVTAWALFISTMKAAATAQMPLQGAGLRILSETVNSPTLGAQIKQFIGQFPQAQWHQWDPVGRNNARVGSKLAFGEFVDARYRLREGRRHPLARRRFPRQRSRRSRLRASVRLAPQGRGRPRDEPPLRRRDDADVDRFAGGSPPAAQAERDCRIRQAGGSWRRCGDSGCGRFGRVGDVGGSDCEGSAGASRYEPGDRW
ncbi:MAG: TAT-variant-translocated molybdopterin oxidoreductase [Vicinamibacterales bacterium]